MVIETLLILICIADECIPMSWKWVSYHENCEILITDLDNQTRYISLAFETFIPKFIYLYTFLVTDTYFVKFVLNAFSCFGKQKKFE